LPAHREHAAIATVKRGTQKFSKAQTHPAGTYVMSIKKMAPTTAGTKRATVTMKLKDAAKTTLIATDKVQIGFDVQ
jgi:hypothetical protein